MKPETPENPDAAPDEFSREPKASASAEGRDAQTARREDAATRGRGDTEKPRRGESTAEKKDRSDRKGPAEPPQPRDVVDGIPDRSSRRQPWKYIVLGAIFLAWLALLIYFAAAK